MREKPFNPELFEWLKRPTAVGEVENVYETDITLRDLFAAAALAGGLANAKEPMAGHAWWAEGAYLFADAMLEVREKP